jgi:predicted RNase H-like nuclease (RuvC/YqgF family)
MPAKKNTKLCINTSSSESDSDEEITESHSSLLQTTLILEQENEKLKEELVEISDEYDDYHSQSIHQDEDEYKRLYKLEKENEKLKEKIEELEQYKASYDDLVRDMRGLEEEIANIEFCDKCGMSDYNPNSNHHCECSSDEDSDSEEEPPRLCEYTEQEWSELKDAFYSDK